MGSHPRSTPKTSIIRRAIRKEGTLTPMVEITATKPETQRCREKAEMVPSRMPTVMAMTKATRPREAVGRMPPMMMSITSRPFRFREVPKSP